MKSKIMEFGEDRSAHFRADIAREKNIIGRKLQAARKTAGLTQGECAREMARFGVSVQTPAVNKWEKGETVPNAYQLIALCHLLKIKNGLGYFIGKLDMESSSDALNAEGRRMLASYRAFLESAPRYQRQYHHTVEMITMPVSLLPASAGLGDYLDNNQFEKKDFPKSSVPDAADFAVRVHGDSMEPAYREGQYAWIEECERLNPGEVGLFILDGDGYIKVYDELRPDESRFDQFVDSNGVVHPQVVLVSYNAAYDPIRVNPESSFQVVGRVLN